MSFTNPRIRAIIHDHRMMIAGIEITLSDWKELAKLYKIGVTSSAMAVAAGIATKAAVAANVAVNDICSREFTQLVEKSTKTNGDAIPSECASPARDRYQCPWYGLDDSDYVPSSDDDDVAPMSQRACWDDGATSDEDLIEEAGDQHIHPKHPRTRRRPERFSKQKQHYHAGFGGSRGSNNAHTSGQVIDDGEWVCKNEAELHGGEYSDCIGCESGSTCNHWHDPIPRNLHGLELEEWWEKQWYRYKSGTGRRAAYECW